jgi:nucleotide-binding universal stress UspA family protein
MFKNILFGTSASKAGDHAARVAFELAGRFNAHICLFHVLGVPTRGFSYLAEDVRTGEQVMIDDDYKAWVEEEIKTYYANQLKNCKDFSIHVAVGHPHREILREERQTKPDLIILGGPTEDSEGSAYKKVVAGSTLQLVAKSAHCPVLLVSRPAASFWGGISSVVFGTDFTKAADEAFRFAKKVVTSIPDCELHLFHAMDIGTVHAGLSLSQEEIEDKIREARKKIRHRYVANLGGFEKYSMEVWEGLPYIEIVKFAREKLADLIVMAHSTREVDADDERLGSNMEQVIMRSNCPVISVNRKMVKS